MHLDSGVLATKEKEKIEELVSVLLAAYGATTNNIDSYICALICKLEFLGVASMSP